MENKISIEENLPRMAVVVMSSGSDGRTLKMRGEVSRGWLCQDWVFDGGTLPIADPLWFPRMFPFRLVNVIKTTLTLI